ncbi:MULTISPECIES: chromate efflux transporter [unclassified Coleofasciculus]|uniref:chromate efflux transporter n=1 Tax=unclassified Coleofasciculus TaxID=2692782 RepID=UPI00187F0A83|nr:MULTISPECIES: chromate efflux transporter [unclassified Coleofasciculus]MBE9126303.1 chromate efflux transporter [Coleofasciculus sp. LEGE 07081]MBE9149222.1 chromate efflux transporter [Coleofasciculus sp. LEGE 07092]
MKSNQRCCTPSLRTLFWMFLKIGSTAWGGFMPLIAVIQNYVKKNNLLKEQEILDAIFLASVLPGPMAFNVVVGVGYRLRGIKGALVCGLGALLPTFMLVLGLSIAYFRWGQIPVIDRLFMGFTPAMVAIVVSAAWSMGRKAIAGVPQLIISVAACAVLVGIGGFYSTIGIVLGSGLVGWLLFRDRRIIPRKPPKPQLTVQSPPERQSSTRFLSVSMLPIMGLLTVQPALVLKLFTTFATLSLTLFGSGYVFIPIIQDLVVNSHSWVTNKEFIDGLAISQITPGPILITSAFIGYKAAGFLGALSATVGMFLPPALLMLVGTYFLDSLKNSTGIKAALEGVRPAVVGMLIAAAFVVSQTIPPYWASAIIFTAALVAIIRFRVEVALIIPLAGLVGLALY